MECRKPYNEGMAKRSRKQRKAAQAESKEARRVTAGKLFRLFLKSLMFALLVALVVMVLELVGLSVTQNFWLQLLIMLAVYIPFYPFIMREFRPKNAARESAKGKASKP